MRDPTPRRQILRQEVLERVIANDPLSSILESITNGIEQESLTLKASILLLDRDRKHLRHGAAPSLPDFYTQAIDGLAIGDKVGSCGTAAFRNERVIVGDIAAHPFWAGFHQLAARASLGSCWSEPIRDAAGRVIGTFALYSGTHREPLASDLELIEYAAQMASIAILRSRAEDKLKLLLSVFQSSTEAITVTDENNRIIAVNPAFTLTTGYTAQEVLGQDPKLLSSGRQSKEFYMQMWQELELHDRWQGEIWNRRKNGEVYVEWLTINVIRDEHGIISRRIAMFSDLTERKRTDEVLWQQTNYDQLSGLPNRRLFADRLQQEMRRAQREQSAVAIMFVDLDRFREVNETHGHDVGDGLLIEAAQRISGSLREADTVSRFSGDEFMIILPGIGEPEAVERVAQDLLGKLAHPFMVGTEQVYLSASIGIALYPDDATDMDELMKRVDQALNAAKASGVNHFCWFREEMQAATKVRYQLIRDLRNALANGQLEVYFQPVVETASERITKAEALLRWKHPEHGMISPASFIPLAEEVGVIVEIGDWVFHQVVDQLAVWRQAGYDLQIAINKSPRQFASGSHQTWLDYLSSKGVPPQALVIEITEGLLLDARPEVGIRLLAFRAAGVTIAIDDFGTGYSALSYLQKFSVDFLKIDRSFINDLTTDLKDRALADAIVAMAQKLGLKVIAEGVETQAQRDHLAEVGCDYIQGWFYGKAVPAAEFEALLLQQAQRPSMPLKA